MTVEIHASRSPLAAHNALEASLPLSELLLFARDLRGTVIDLVVAAAGRALVSHPRLGGSVAPGDLGVGIAVAVRDRIRVVTVRSAGTAPLPQVRAEVEQLVAAARAGHPRSLGVGDPAVTVHGPPASGETASTVVPGRRVLSVEGLAEDSPMLTIALIVAGDEPTDEEAAFFAELVRLLRQPYRRLV